MAKKKKSRVPAPPKRTVQAPRPYHAPRDPRRTRLVLLALAGAIVVAAIVVGIAMAVGRGGGGAAAIKDSQVCNLQNPASQGRRHVEELAKDFEYNSVPATSGQHYAQPRGPAIWNLYTDSIQQEILVHNLEHGGVVVQYGSKVSPSTVAQIEEWYANDPRGLVVAPLLPELEEAEPELANKIAVTAWQHLMTCGAFDEAAFDGFLDEYRGPGGDAPEKFPLDALQPGGQ